MTGSGWRSAYLTQGTGTAQLPPTSRPDQEETPPKNAKRETERGKEKGEPGRETWVRPYPQAKGRPPINPTLKSLKLCLFPIHRS